MLPTLEGCKTFEDFQKIVNSSYLLEGLDNVNINDDEANKFVTETWKETMNDGNTLKYDSLVTFKECLQILSQKAKSFACTLAVDNSGTIDGAVWQTATTRGDFEKLEE